MITTKIKEEFYSIIGNEMYIKEQIVFNKIRVKSMREKIIYLFVINISINELADIFLYIILK